MSANSIFREGLGYRTRKKEKMVSIDSKAFYRRISRIEPPELGVSSVVVCVGTGQEDQSVKSVALQSKFF